MQVLLPNDVQKVQKILPTINKVICIGNAVPQWKEVVSYDNKKIITVSHIEPNVKRPHLIVEVFAKIAEKFSDWTLEIWGNDKYNDGYTQKINGYIKQYGLDK